jgi:glucan 1,3-beta-glucosidase
LVVEKVPLESLGIGGWANSLALAALAFALPVAATAALVRSTATPTFARVLGRAVERPADPLAFVLGFCLVALAVLAVQRAFGLVFDPRYRDFPYAQLTMAVVPCLGLVLLRPRAKAPREAAEALAAAALALAAVFIAFNEGFANWQAVWSALALLGLAVTLWRSRDAQS